MKVENQLNDCQPFFSAQQKDKLNKTNQNEAFGPNYLKLYCLKNKFQQRQKHH